eukprot:8085304-Alexandrium_andersonii.AAC.1
MSGGEPDQPPGLPARAKRSRSEGATSAAATSSATPTSAPTPLGPLGAGGVYRRAPSGPSSQATPADPDRVRDDERRSGEAGWQS